MSEFLKIRTSWVRKGTKLYNIIGSRVEICGNSVLKGTKRTKFVKIRTSGVRSMTKWYNIVSKSSVRSRILIFFNGRYRRERVRKDEISGNSFMNSTKKYKMLQHY